MLLINAQFSCFRLKSDWLKRIIMNQFVGITPFLFLLFACSTPTHKAPIEDVYVAPPQRVKKHIVAPGETLYSIALVYDLDYKKLSKINSLGNGSAIVPGQILDLDVNSIKPNSASESVVKSDLKAIGATFKYVADEVVRSIQKQTVSPVKKPTESHYSAKVKWSWPVKGEVLTNFKGNNGLNKGIDIRGKLGESVYAAAEGEVVYAGSGLRGYGKLVIIKHNDKFLSAYAHNRVLSVTEGDMVKAGNKIAEVGYTGTTQTAKLHFEIRFDGKPVDPMKYLPTF